MEEKNIEEEKNLDSSAKLYNKTFGNFSRRFLYSVDPMYEALEVNSFTGKIKIKKPGLHINLPWKKTSIVYVGEQNADNEVIELQTKDQILVYLDAGYRFEIVDTELAYTKNRNVFFAIKDAVKNILQPIFLERDYEDCKAIDLGSIPELKNLLKSFEGIPVRDEDGNIERDENGRAMFKPTYGVRIKVFLKQDLKPQKDIQEELEKKKRAEIAYETAEVEVKTARIKADAEIEIAEKKARALKKAELDEYKAFMLELKKEGITDASQIVQAIEYGRGGNANIIKFAGDQTQGEGVVVAGQSGVQYGKAYRTPIQK